MSACVQWVKQEHPCGCGIAALAMLTGQTYQQVASDFSHPLEDGAALDLKKAGLSVVNMDRYLAERGFAVCRLFLRDLFSPREEWPPEPFADMHLCCVKIVQGARNRHWVVMLGDRSVLDPATPVRRHLRYYYEVYHAAAVVRLRTV